MRKAVGELATSKAINRPGNLSIIADCSHRALRVTLGDIQVLSRRGHCTTATSAEEELPGHFAQQASHQRREFVLVAPTAASHFGNFLEALTDKPKSSK